MKNYLLQKNKIHKQRGLSLLETIIAISIFSISVLAILVILGSGISNINSAKRKVVASFLAEEGVEVIRNIRDTYDQYITTGDGWVNFRDKLTIAQCSTNPYGCYFDIEKNESGAPYDVFAQVNRPMPITKIFIGPCTLTGCPEILYNTTTGKYTYTSGANTVSTGLRRDIKMEINRFNTDEIKIISTVSWTQGGNSQSVSFYDNLYNWLP